ncbi:hypothetical protein GJAV_G00146890 [Gymnothorax javanicus]|nr:hypothetical protein GJAV_G00146890 [Gymnothorax javanicus]
MAGPGMALRLHEFKETSSPNTAASSRVTRQGRDTLGIYPGQVGRVHVTPSSNHRARSALQVDLEDQYPVAFDLQTLRTLQVYRNTSGPIEHSASTSYQEAFGSLSCLYPSTVPSGGKYTAISHPGPLRPSDPAAIRK